MFLIRRKYSIKSIIVFLDKYVLSLLLVFGIIQAVMGNIFHVKFPFISAFIIFHTLIRVYARYMLEDNFSLSTIELIISILFFTQVAYGASINFSSLKDFFYLVNIPIIMFWISTLNVNSNLNFSFFFKLLIIYCILSLIIYLFFWEFFAQIFFIDETGKLLSLRTSGIPRSYGLLFAPLSNGYILLIGLSFYLFKNKNFTSTFYFILFSQILSLVRLSMISVIMIIFSNIILHKKIKALFFIFLLSIICYITIQPFQDIINQAVSLNDSQGSAQKHAEDLNVGFNYLINEYIGIGIKDEHIESWLLRYPIHFGLFGTVLILSWLSYVFLSLLIRKKIYEFLIIVSFVPVMIGIPFNEFNLPITLFFLMIKVFLNYHNPSYSFENS